MCQALLQWYGNKAQQLLPSGSTGLIVDQLKWQTKHTFLVYKEGWCLRFFSCFCDKTP